MKKIVAIYIRVSTLDQAEKGYSLEAQEKILRKWCADKNYAVYDLYADRGISAKDIEHRPAMGRLLRDAEQERFDIVLFWSLSRFTRSVSDLYITIGKLQKWNVAMMSYTEGFDMSTHMGRAMIGIVGVFAQLERELIGERVSAAIAERATQGRHTCTEVLGYDIDGKNGLIINEKEAEYVRFCFDEYLKCKNLTKVAAAARAKGYKGKRGKFPAANSIRIILTRPVYCGYNSFCGCIYKGSHQAIISADIYNATQILLTKRRGTYDKQNMHPAVIIPVDTEQKII